MRFNFIMIFAFTVNAFAFDYATLEANKTEFINEALKKYKSLDYNQSSNHRYEDENKDNERNAQPKKSFMAPDYSYLYNPSSYPPQYASIVDELKRQYADNQRMTLTVFYLFTTSMNDESLKSFMILGAKLQDKYPDFKYYAVLRGFPRNVNLLEFLNKYKGINSAKKLHININPLLYRKLNVDKAPAYALAFCPKGELNIRACEFKYLVRGDMTLEGFMEIVSDQDARYIKFLQGLQDVR